MLASVPPRRTARLIPPAASEAAAGDGVPASEAASGVAAGAAISMQGNAAYRKGKRRVYD